MRPEAEQARLVFSRYAVRPDDDGVPRLYGVKRVREDDPLPHVRIHDLRVVDDGAEHDQPAGTAGFVFLDGLIELAQGKPYPHAESRCFGAAILLPLSSPRYCRWVSGLAVIRSNEAGKGLFLKAPAKADGSF